jgi:hypothetical protein
VNCAFDGAGDFDKQYCGARNVQVSRSLNPSLRTFDDWLAQNKDRIPIG